MCFACMYTYYLAGAHRVGSGQKWESDPLELELKMVVNHRVGAGFKPRSSTRAKSILNTEPSLQL